MTFQFLTVSMINKARTNGGFIDQTEFKTAARYIFDTLIIDDDVLALIDLYLQHIRPRLNPQCDYVLLSTNGTQFQSLTTSMTMLVHEAIGKYIHLTRYRQIVETESSERLTLEEQHFITEDQKHSSHVAKDHYKKMQSRIVAIEGKKCMEKMTSRAEKNSDLFQMFREINLSFNSDVLNKSQQIISNVASSGTSPIDASEIGESSSSGDPYQPVLDVNDSMDLVITESENVHPVNTQFSNVSNNDIPIKHEIASSETKRIKNIKFTAEEDRFLNEGIKK